jgi:hypothetical protein
VSTTSQFLTFRAAPKSTASKQSIIWASCNMKYGKIVLEWFQNTSRSQVLGWNPCWCTLENHPVSIVGVQRDCETPYGCRFKRADHTEMPKIQSSILRNVVGKELLSSVWNTWTPVLVVQQKWYVTLSLLLYICVSLLFLHLFNSSVLKTCSKLKLSLTLPSFSFVLS